MTNLQCCHSKLDIMHGAFMLVCGLFYFYPGIKRSGIIYLRAFWEYA